MKRIFLIFIFIFLFSNVSYSIEADDSVDEIIKRQYNASSTESSKLPSLPKTSPKSIESKNFFDIGGSNQQTKKQTQTQKNNSNYANVDNIPKTPQKSTKSFKVNEEIWSHTLAKAPMSCKRLENQFLPSSHFFCCV